MTGAARTGYIICLVLTILLVGLHFAGNHLLRQLLELDTFGIKIDQSHPMESTIKTKTSIKMLHSSS